ncbi:MAG: ATP-dependent Clp protease adaptor ClpS [Nitrospirota bacterium]
MSTSTPVLPERDVDATVERIPPYKIIFLDDPVTTMEFVVHVLTHVFQKDSTTAARLMWEVHTTGAAHVATLPLEQAELKQTQVYAAAKAAGFPFRCVIEPA